MNVAIDYTNWRKERAKRCIQPTKIWFGTSEYHREEGDQWFLQAYDIDKGQARDFALKDIHGWEPGEGSPRGRVTIEQLCETTLDTVTALYLALAVVIFLGTIAYGAYLFRG